MTRRRPAAAGQGDVPADDIALDLFASGESPPPAPRPSGGVASERSPGATRARRAGRAAAVPDARPAPTLEELTAEVMAAVSPEPDGHPEAGEAPGPVAGHHDGGPIGHHDIPGSSARTAVPISLLTTTAKEVLEGAFLPLWVRGEVSDFKRHRNGHWYFSLRDATSQIRCVVWSRDQRGFPASPDDGMQVTALGQVTVYAARGDLQFTVKAMEAAGDGLWRKALERARQALERDGLLAPERRRPLPRYPRRIAVITSPSGAALHDVIAVARRRWAAVELVVVPARVQGDGAPEELCAALDQVARWGDLDVVIIGRGGGAREDLWAFNDERVARAVAACPVPVISAVGHEVDVTLCDLVADLRAATPSAAAEAAVPVHAEAAALAGRLGAELQMAMAARLERAATRREQLAGTLRGRADWLLERRGGRCQQLAGRLHVLSPLATLARGYAVARGENGATLASVDSFRPGGHFDLLLRDGRVSATADSVEPGTPQADPSARSSTRTAADPESLRTSASP
ncbi:MAG: exodeoxyribonuclease VII large subunit [Gemmatimonadaceae bacterium]